MNKLTSIATRTSIPGGDLSLLLVPVGALALGLLALRHTNVTSMTDIGLVSVLSPLFYVAVGLLTMSFCWAVWRLSVHPSVLVTHLAALILIIHGTPSYLYKTLHYSWAWKHVGVVEFISRRGTIDPQLDVYNNWPGFFALNAFFTQVAGLQSALDYALWMQVCFNLLYMGALVFVFDSITSDRRLVWLATWLFFLASWVGQDYFSPQAYTYLLYLIVLGICLRWFSNSTERAGHRFVRLSGIGQYITRLIGAKSSIADAPPTESVRVKRLELLPVVFLFCVVIAASHQLTPLMLISALAALVLFGQCRQRGLPVLVAVFTLVWIIYVAEAFVRQNANTWIVQSIGQMTNNLDSNVVDVSSNSPGQQLVATVGRVLTVGVWCLAFAGFIRRVKHGRFDLSCILLAVCPFPLILASSYGGEMLLRAYFFSLPFMVFFIGALIFPSRSFGKTLRTLLSIVGISGVLFSGLAITYYGRERMNYFTPPEVSAATYLFNEAPPGSLILDVTFSHPSRFHNYEQYTFQTLVPIPTPPDRRLERYSPEMIAALMTSPQRPAAYLFVTRSQKAQAEMYNVGSIDNLESQMRSSPLFQIVYENPDATIFTLSSQVPH